MSSRLLAVLLLYAAATNIAHSEPVADFSLLDHLGQTHQLSNYSSSDLRVFFVQQNGDSISRNTIPALQALCRQFQRRGVEFLLLNSSETPARNHYLRDALNNILLGNTADFDLPAVIGTPLSNSATDERENNVSDTDIREFTIAVSDQAINDLKLRLSLRRTPDQLNDISWEYGTDLRYLQELLDYWQTDFDWRRQETMLNSFDQYKTNIEGLDLHFIHHRSPHPNAIPLLIVHGWPGSVAEFHKIIGPLTDPVAYGGTAADAFHVIVPSLPGFGFSDKPSDAGYSPEKIAHLLAGLMERLGYTRYGLQGGDWGAIINRYIAGNYPERLIGLHSNFVLAGNPGDVDGVNPATPEELEKRATREAYMANERAYQQIQGTKPQTLGYSLNDSPAGLAAWIVEKFHGWSDLPQDSRGDLNNIFTMDELLTNISIYWFTETITSSTRIYYENRNTPRENPLGYIEVPTAGAIFPAEITATPRSWAENSYNIVRWTVMPRGGHFAALEEPELLIEDVRSFFRELR